MDSYIAFNGTCFMVTCTVLKNHPLKIDPTQNQETMALRTLKIIDLFILSCARIHVNRNSLK
jgi:hypothetical protein